MKFYTLTDFTKDAPLGGAAGVAAVSERVTILGITFNDLILWAGAVYAVGRLAMLACEFYWKWKEHRDGESK